MPSALDRNPITTDLASPQNYIFVMARAPSLSYQCQAVKLPDVVLDPVEKATPSLNVPFIGDHVTYSPIVITFKVDANFQNWQEILNWIEANGNPKGDAIGYNILDKNSSVVSPYTIYSDIGLIQLDAQQNPIMRWYFEKAHPIRLTGPSFDSRVSDEMPYITSDVTFKFVRFGIEVTK